MSLETRAIFEPSNMVLKYNDTVGAGRTISPANSEIEHWIFKLEDEDEAFLANQMAKVAQKNGIDEDTLRRLFPAVLRMLNSDSEWSKK